MKVLFYSYLCDSDMLAVGVYKAAHRLGQRLPEDLSVVDFDDSLLARILEPELTTIAIPTTRIGEEAFLLLHALLEGKPVATSALVPLELVVRASTAAHHKSDTNVLSTSLHDTNAILYHEDWWKSFLAAA